MAKSVSRRIERLNGLFREELSDLIRRDLKDPRLGSIVSITAVETAPDLHHARVYVSVLGSSTEQRETMATLRRAAGFLRHELATRLRIRTVPELDFRFDESIARGDRILRLIREATGESPKRPDGAGTDESSGLAE